MLGILLNSVIKKYLIHRYSNLELRFNSALESQNFWLDTILSKSQNTKHGKSLHLVDVNTYEEFKKAVKIKTYEEYFPLIDRMLHGEPNVLWPGKITWFSKSSGTSNAQSKFIPISSENLKHCHIKGPWDSLAVYMNKYPDSMVFRTKTIVMGGSLDSSPHDPEIKIGDVSAIMMDRMPAIGKFYCTPEMEISLMKNWEEKIERIADKLIHEDISLFGGVPTWTIVLFNRILEKTGAENMSQVWPSVEAYLHGGVGFSPYRDSFDRLIGKKINYQEIYNASEGYFAAQDAGPEQGMRLFVDNGVFYEFVPFRNGTYQYEEAVPLSDVETGQVYAMLLTANNGLLRYQIGDTIQFTSTAPYRIKITGRTKQFINAFGEEVMVANTDEAISRTCRACNCRVVEYTVAPVYLNANSSGRHHWLIEFEQEPTQLDKFTEILDVNLQKLNGDYQAKRTADLALTRLHITPLERDTFMQWMKSREKLGGQHKVPRLSNDRKYLEELLNYVKS